MLEQRCVFLNTKHRRAARDQADTAKIHNFYGSIDATQASSYQCMLNRMFEVLEVHSYFGTIVPHDKSGKIEQILEFAVKEHNLDRTFLLVMLYQFLHITLVRRKAYKLYIADWVNWVLYRTEETDQYDLGKTIVPHAELIYKRITYKTENRDTK